MEMKLNGRVLIAAGLALGLGFTGARAQDVPDGCVQQGQNAATGALLGGVAGALLGNAVSGRHKAGGTIVGGVTGAAAGAMIGGSQPCPDGYAYRAAPARVMEDDAPPPRVRDGGEFWDGAPSSIRERIGFLRRRIEKLDADGWLSPRETEGLTGRVSEIADREESIRDRHDGHLPPEARSRLTADLNDVARKLRWKEYRRKHAEE